MAICSVSWCAGEAVGGKYCAVHRVTPNYRPEGDKPPNWDERPAWVAAACETCDGEGECEETCECSHCGGESDHAHECGRCGGGGKVSACSVCGYQPNSRWRLDEQKTKHEEQCWGSSANVDQPAEAAQRG